MEAIWHGFHLRPEDLKPGMVLRPDRLLEVIGCEKVGRRYRNRLGNLRQALVRYAGISCAVRKKYELHILTLERASEYHGQLAKAQLGSCDGNIRLGVAIDTSRFSQAATRSHENLWMEVAQKRGRQLPLIGHEGGNHGETEEDNA